MKLTTEQQEALMPTVAENERLAVSDEERTVLFIPFTFIHPPTWEALAGRAVIGIYVGRDENDYLRYFRDRWAAGEVFVNIEHDVILQPGQLEELAQCHSDWCCIPELEGGPSLSIARFRPAFIAANRDLWGRRWVLPTGQRPAWSWLDSHLVRAADRPPCLHRSIPAINSRPRGVLHAV